jgi:agmatine deiminase
METELHNFQTDDGNPYRLIPLPIPQPIIDETGARLPATYANYLVINGAVLLPTYGDPNDETAHRLLAAQYTGREILPIDCRPLIHQYGSLHCMTMQFPASLALKSP